MNDALERPTLKWSTQLDILPAKATPVLKGDRIILPPSALEQLLSASTVTISNASHPQTNSFDPFNPHSYAAERQARQQLLKRQQQLPHPLTFRLVNPANGRAVFAGIREFSAPEGSIGLGAFLRQTLGVAREHNYTNALGNGAEQEDCEDISSAIDQSDPSRLTIHVQRLPKGSYVRFRPLEAGYDPEDWKALLEQYLRSTFTTLTNREVVTIPAGRETYRFLVDGLRPNEEAISLVDTDLEVDIEPLNEEQARQTLQKLAQKLQKTSASKDGSSSGGTLHIDTVITGQVKPGEYVDYKLEAWDRTRDLNIELNHASEGEDVDIFVNPLGRLHRSKPREDEYVQSDLTSSLSKNIKILSKDIGGSDTDALLISVRGYVHPEGLEVQSPVHYSLGVSMFNSQRPHADESSEVHVNDDEERCSNCLQPVPRRTMFLHQNFCLRNNILCPECNNVFQKSSKEWKEHWHCPHDRCHGISAQAKTKHDNLFHTSAVCSTCDYQAANNPDLAFHRTTSCPGRLILCQFCHLQVAQCGPEDPSPDSAEVILSGLTPHEVSDGARTTECHLCMKIVRLRDMPTHLKHHDFQRLSRPKPRVCRNVNCGRVIDAVSSTGDVRQQPARNELGLCDTCFGPLYVSMYDPEGKALKRRMERKYMTQLLTGCGQAWCRNELCKSGRRHLCLLPSDQSLTSKEAMQMIKPLLADMTTENDKIQLCTDEASQKRRTVAEMVAAEGEIASGKLDDMSEGAKGTSSGYELGWCVAALEVESGDLDKARAWMKGLAPTRAETAGT